MDAMRLMGSCPVPAQGGLFYHGPKSHMLRVDRRVGPTREEKKSKVETRQVAKERKFIQVPLILSRGNKRPVSNLIFVCEITSFVLPIGGT